MCSNPFNNSICSFLAGEGAFQWAVEHGLTTCRDEDLITGEFVVSYMYLKQNFMLKYILLINIILQVVTTQTLK